MKLMFLGYPLQKSLSDLIFLSSVSKLWAKKNAVGKEQVAKLVDDTYRSVLKTVVWMMLSS